MAIFGNDTKKKSAKKAEKTVTVAASSAKTLSNTKLESVIKAPWLSEKALIGTEKGIYVFEVPRDATKPEIKAAIERIYKVVPVKVNIVNLPRKSKAMRTKRGMGFRAARHKAYVHLKKGETITFA